MQEVLTQGYTAEYGKVFSPYSELPHDDCRLVYDILDMFRVMKASIAELDETERAALLADHKYVLFFQGFDGNDAREGKMASYVDYLQATGRWRDLVDDVKAADGGNSHSLMLSRYQAMLDVYDPIWREKMRAASMRHLNADELGRIAESRG
ncbi:MAG TPA: YfbU family protein [Acidimicrobiales bacterium]|nr:YfbU family protein [Acidimicrobiales bacterium]